MSRRRRRVLAAAMGGFSPIQLAPMAWYDASTTPVGSVATWNDISGNGYNAIQLVFLNQPTCTANQINGLNSLVFNGMNALVLPSGLFLVPNGDNTLFVVGKIASETGNAQYYISMTELLSVRWYLRSSATAGNNLFLSSTGTTGGVSVAAGDNTLPHIMSCYKSGTTQSISINNAAAATNTNGANESGIDGGQIGALAMGGFITGQIGEIIIFNKLLSPSEIIQVNQYLGAKWGITIS